jgi:hypothetical protein
LKKFIPVLLFVGVSGLLLFLVRKIDMLHEENQDIVTVLSQLKAQQVELAQSMNALKLAATPIATTPAVVPEPSRNPAKDITGASARVVKRTATQNQCARVCSTMIHCLSTSMLCPNIGTGGTREATQRCAKLCSKDQKTRNALMDMTDCPKVLDPDVPPPLRFICIDS